MARQVIGPRGKYVIIILLHGHSITQTLKDISFKYLYFKNKNNY